MTGVFGEMVSLAQESGPDLELRVHGDEHYARYETPSGHTVVYDRSRGLFCYAALDERGGFVSTGVAATEPPPAGASPHLEEAAAVRMEKASASTRRGPQR